ncbi:MAG TPA: hypothetical protein VHU18_01110 [Rhizomicrobium sp.]|jgi:hypothetical protein|nr:hypothetical protein [Rhizomicrobium sp.]
MFKVITSAFGAALLASQAQAASPNGPAAAAVTPAIGQYCSWGTGTYSNGTRMCVSSLRLMICVNGEWRVDETRTPFTEDVCRQDNARAPAFGK